MKSNLIPRAALIEQEVRHPIVRLLGKLMTSPKRSYVRNWCKVCRSYWDTDQSGVAEMTGVPVSIPNRMHHKKGCPLR
jgi:hypothetical protein